MCSEKMTVIRVGSERTRRIGGPINGFVPGGRVRTSASVSGPHAHKSECFASARGCRHPAHALAGHILRHFEPTLELAERHLVPQRHQSSDDHPAALIDGKNLI